MRGMRAQGLENVLKVMGEEVEAHEEQEHGHSEASQHFCTLKTKRVSDGGSLPNFKVVEDVDPNAYRGRYSVEKYQV
jgi:hypothetical protein